MQSNSTDGAVPPPSQDIAEVKDFDLRRMLSLINAFSGDTRELVLSLLQVGLQGHIALGGCVLLP